MFPGPVNVCWSSYNEIRSSEAAFWQVATFSPIFWRVCYMFPGFGSGTEMCHVFHPNASNSNYNEISPHCNGSNSNFPQFQGDSPSVTKGTSGVAVVGTRGELNRYSPTEIQSCVETLLSRVFDNVLYACAQLLLSGKLWITFCIRWGAEVIGRQGNGLRLKVSIFFSFHLS